VEIDAKITDNSGEFLKEMPQKLERAMIAIGLTAESYAKQDCPVDTGRLRNSITHAVESKEQAVYIGTNVEYAAYVELGTSRQTAQPYLKPAASEHSSEYREIVEQAMKE